MATIANRLSYTPTEAKQTNCNSAVNDVILMRNVSLFLRTWKLGRVTAVYKGSDGLVHVVDVTNGQKNLSEANA